MTFFIGIAGPWLVVALLLFIEHRRAENEDATTAHWRSQPSLFFGGPDPRPDVEPEGAVPVRTPLRAY